MQPQTMPNMMGRDGMHGMPGQGMPEGMMDHGMMGMEQGGQGEMSAMRRLPLKIMFAIIDSNGDGALSFDEVSAIHKRIFDMIDANRDGNITPQEIQSFLQD